MQAAIYGGFAWGTFGCAGLLHVPPGLLTRVEVATLRSFSSEHLVAQVRYMQ